MVLCCALWLSTCEPDEPLVTISPCVLKYALKSISMSLVHMYIPTLEPFVAVLSGHVCSLVHVHSLEPCVAVLSA